MVFSCGVVLFLVIAGPILSFETEQDRLSYATFISWSFCALNCGAPFLASDCLLSSAHMLNSDTVIYCNLLIMLGSGALLLVFLVAFAWVAILYLRRRINPVKPFKIFLTHHKGAAGNLARFIKCILSKYLFRCKAEDFFNLLYIIVKYWDMQHAAYSSLSRQPFMIIYIYRTQMQLLKLSRPRTYLLGSLKIRP